MELTLEQKAAVGRWIEDGERLADVQRRIREEFGIQLTYMEVRLLALDIGATPKDKAPAAPERDGGASARPQDEAGSPQPDELGFSGESSPEDGSPQAPEDEAEDLDSADGLPPIGGSVKVELDKVVRAGAAMSGTVTFSDGVTGNWMLDAYGRLALTKVSKPNYQPSNADISAFQLELQRKISGY